MLCGTRAISARSVGICDGVPSTARSSFIYIFLTSGVKLNIHLLNVVVQFIVFLTLSTLICRGTDISKYFSESLGIRDNESRLYIWKTLNISSDSPAPSMILVNYQALLSQKILQKYSGMLSTAVLISTLRLDCQNVTTKCKVIK